MDCALQVARVNLAVLIEIVLLYIEIECHHSIKCQGCPEIETHGETTIAMNGEGFQSVGLEERIRELYALDPTAVAVEYGDHWYNYGELRRIAAELQRLLADLNCETGTAVGFLLRNRPAHLAAAIGVMTARHCIVTINPMIPPAPLAEDIEQLRVPILIADAEDWGNPAVLEAARRIGCVGVTIRTETGSLEIAVRPEMTELSRSGYRAAKPGAAMEMLSSGTTGKPKRIELKLRSLSHSLFSAAAAESRDPRQLELRTSVQLQWMPLVHIAGIWNALYALYNGRRLALLERFDLDDWHRLLVRHRPKFANFPPSALRMVLERQLPKEDFSSLIAIRTGTAPLDPELALAFEKRYGIPVLQAYGATEFAGGAAGWTIQDYRKFGNAKRQSVGRANAGVALRVVDQSSFEPLEANQQGLLEVQTRQVGDGLSWIRTTDLASIDEDGFLYLYGRSDSAINRGGFKVFPDNVEAALRSHPSIYDACVVGMNDSRLGQVPVAALQLQPSESAPSADTLNHFLRERLKPYEIPVAFRVVHELPRTPSLKVSQPAVRALFES
jgi:long-chain acyl-CoA synthetase